MAATPEISEPTQRLSLTALILTSIYTLGVNAVWLSYNLFILPVQVQSVTSESTKGIVLGVLVGGAVGFAVIVNIIAGIISDHSNSRFGRRRPMLILGMILTLPFILLPIFFPLTLFTVSLAFLGIQIFTNVSSAAFQPTLADFVPEVQRGASAGYKGVFTLIGSAIGVGVITALFAANLAKAAYIMIAAVFALTTLINAYAMRPYDKPLLNAKPLKWKEVLVDMFHFQKQTNGFYWFVFGSFLIYMGVSGFQFFGVYYIETILHITRPDAVARAIQISGLLGLLVSIVLALLAGYLSDKYGRRNIIIITVLLAGIVGLLFPFVKTFAIFLIFSTLYSASNGVILSVGTAFTSDLVPLEEAGKYMAYANLATGVASVFAPPIYGLILNYQGAPNLTSFLIFFFVSATFFVLSSIVMALKVPNK